MRSAELVREQYGGDFTFLYWDDDNETTSQVLSRFEGAKFDVIRISEIIPREEWGEALLPHDSHPRPKTYRKIAQFLARGVGTDTTRESDR